MSPVRRWSSEWQSPAAANLISTSPSLGGSRSSSTISQSLPMSLSTAALVFMLCLPASRSIRRHHPPDHPARSLCPAPRVPPTSWHYALLSDRVPQRPRPCHLPVI